MRLARSERKLGRDPEVVGEVRAILGFDELRRHAPASNLEGDPVAVAGQHVVDALVAAVDHEAGPAFPSRSAATATLT